MCLVRTSPVHYWWAIISFVWSELPLDTDLYQSLKAKVVWHMVGLLVENWDAACLRRMVNLPVRWQQNHFSHHASLVVLQVLHEWQTDHWEPLAVTMPSHRDSPTHRLLKPTTLILLTMSGRSSSLLLSLVCMSRDREIFVSNATTMVEVIQYITELNTNASKMQNKSNPNRNWSATKQHLSSVARIRCHSALSEDRIRQCVTSSESRRRDQISVCKSPFPSVGTAVSLFRTKTVQ